MPYASIVHRRLAPTTEPEVEERGDDSVPASRFPDPSRPSIRSRSSAVDAPVDVVEMSSRRVTPHTPCMEVSRRVDAGPGASRGTEIGQQQSHEGRCECTRASLTTRSASSNLWSGIRRDVDTPRGDYPRR